MERFYGIFDGSSALKHIIVEPVFKDLFMGNGCRVRQWKDTVVKIYYP